MHGAQDALSEQMLLNSRACTVMREVAENGWETLRTRCVEALVAARQLWSQAENLVIEAAEVDVDGDGLTLSECQRLLAACDRLVASEEEILDLNDLSAETYVIGHTQRDLVWQKFFCDKS
jgi:hypothetical protein